MIVNLAHTLTFLQTSYFYNTMRKFISKLTCCSLLLLTFGIGAFAQKPGHQIIVHIPTLKDTTCFLANYYGDKQYIMDTVTSDGNGTVVFQGKETLPGGIYLFVFPDKRYFEMIIDKEQYFSMETSWDDPIHSMKVKGSKENELFYNYLTFAVDLQKNSSELQEKLKSATSKNDSSTVLEQMRANDKKMDEYRSKLAQEHPETFLAKIFKTMPEPVVPKDVPLLSNGRKDSTFAYHFFKIHYLDNVDFSDRRSCCNFQILKDGIISFLDLQVLHWQ